MTTSASNPLSLDLPPMEAEAVDELPIGTWLAVRAEVRRLPLPRAPARPRVHLQSKNQKPLERYFPEVAQGLEELAEDDFVLDGELVIPGGSFESLQLRLHPAESRIRKLARRRRRSSSSSTSWRAAAVAIDRPLAERRRALDAFMAKRSPRCSGWERRPRRKPWRGSWLGQEGLDSIVAKRLDLPYLPGERAMRKFKLWKTVDCVVAGLYRKGSTQAVEHLLLGLYDEEGRLNYVGRARMYEDAAEIGRLLEPLVGGSGFTGRAPGGKSRWSGKERAPVPLEPVLVVEVSADHITGEHMRHGARLLRWRTDKAPRAARWIRSGESAAATYWHPGKWEMI